MRPIRPKKLCSVQGCERPSRRRGWCARHYWRWATHGDPTVITIAPKGSGTLNGNGYRQNGRQIEHIQIAERALGRPLPKGVEVHHVNEIRSDNSPGNLVICPDRAYHKLLHIRTDAHDACGNANYRRCTYCKRYDDQSNLKYCDHVYLHPACRTQYRRDYRQRRRDAGLAYT
jgi:HNH endonuclease